MTRQIGKLILLLTALVASTSYADLVATVDRTIISDADLLTLTVRASNSTADIEPDFSVLDRDFEVISLSPQRNSSFSIVNGKTTSISYVDYVIRLAPKRLGELTETERLEPFPDIVGHPCPPSPIRLAGDRSRR